MYNRLVRTMYGRLVRERLCSGVCAELNEGMRRETMRDNWLVGMSKVLGMGKDMKEDLAPEPKSIQ